MVAIAVGEQLHAQLTAMNQYNRYQLYTIKASAPEDILKEVRQLSGCSHVVMDLSQYSFEDDLSFYAQLADTTRVILLAQDIDPYSLVVRDFYSLGITDVITTNGEQLQKMVNDILLRDGANVRDASADAPAENEPAPIPAAGQRKVYASTRKSAGTHTIAFAGAGPRIGTTTQLLQTVWYLKSLYHKVAIVDLSAGSRMADCCGEQLQKLGEGRHLVSDTPLYTDIRALTQAKSQYDYLVFDYGRFDDIRDTVSFAEKDTQVIVCGMKPQEETYLSNVFDSDPGCYWYLFSFCPASQRNNVRLGMVDSASHTIFAAHAPDYWKYCGEDALYRQITGTGQKSERSTPPRGGLINRVLGGRRK